MPTSLSHFGISTSGCNPASCCGALDWLEGNAGAPLHSINPCSEETLASVATTTRSDFETVVSVASRTFRMWREVPAPKRGEVIRSLGEELRKEKAMLAELVSLEMGKILPEALGEVQEMIDMCDFAVGLSRQLYGLSMHSERPRHRMYEQWHPLGIVGVISAFNFPVAVWSWNAIVGAICGNTIIWKPSPKTPLSAIAVQKICNRVMDAHNCKGLFNLIQGGTEQGRWISEESRIPLVSATGSVLMGKQVAKVVAARLGRSLLELGGNNAIIIDKSASIDLATRAIVFAAIGTSGQRCTSLRRLFVHKSVKDDLIDRLKDAYHQLRVGDPLLAGTLMGPLIDKAATTEMEKAVEIAKAQGGSIISPSVKVPEKGYFVSPVIMNMPNHSETLHHETFAPLLYLLEFEELEEAIALQNSVPQGLSSALFTRDLMHAERFLSASGSDCGIANINIGTSGAEIGGAFGGEKETGGGREAGSDAWKFYMRRQTTTINWSSELPLAQGITFG